MARNFVCGDIHLPFDIHKLSNKKWPLGKTLSKKDVLIQLGDFGGIWYQDGENDEQEYWLDWLAEKQYTTAVVLGNHENYDLIEKLPQIKKWSGTVKVIKRQTGDIFILERGAAYIINGQKILTIGGAFSVDKSSRTPGVSWWPQEDITPEEINNCWAVVDKYDRVFDFILTHTCPSRLISSFIHLSALNSGRVFNDRTAQFLDDIDNAIEFQEWHFGHMHTDYRLESNRSDIYHCHYNAEPYELKVT